MTNGRYIVTVIGPLDPDVDDTALSIVNIDTPVLRVRHSDLVPVRSGGLARCCPLCRAGMLLLMRDNAFALLPADYCILCAQKFEYIDVDELERC